MEFHRCLYTIYISPYEIYFVSTRCSNPSALCMRMLNISNFLAHCHLTFEANPIIYARYKAERQIYEWQLDLLSREIILNSPVRGTKTLRSWPQFAKVINTIKNLEETVYVAHRQLLQDNIILEMFRLAHRQFPWQRRPNEDTLLRYYKIFNTPEFEPIIRNAIGISAPEIYTIGLGFAGHFMGSFTYYLNSTIEVREISAEGFNHFVDHFSADLASFKTNGCSSPII
jgi:hypothetical protein